MSQKRGNLNSKMKPNKPKWHIQHDKPQKVEYLKIKIIKIFGFDQKSQNKMNSYSDLLMCCYHAHNW